MKKNLEKWLEINLPAMLMIYEGNYNKWDDVPQDEQAAFMNESEEVIANMKRYEQFSEF